MSVYLQCSENTDDNKIKVNNNNNNNDIITNNENNSFHTFVRKINF